MIRRNWVKVSAIACLLCIYASGCSWQIGGDKSARAPAQPTKGQELADLKKARDQQAISESEYQEQRNKILQR